MASKTFLLGNLLKPVTSLSIFLLLQMLTESIGLLCKVFVGFEIKFVKFGKPEGYPFFACFNDLGRLYFHFMEQVLKFKNLVPRELKTYLVGKYCDINLKALEKRKSPLTLILFVTKKCNSRCKHCFYWQEINSADFEMTTDQYRKLAKSFNAPINTLLVSGGEPFLRKDLFEIIKAFHQENKTRKVNIDSNGLLTDEIPKVVENMLKAIPVDLSVQISLDGFKDTYKKIRGVDGFEKAVSTVQKLLELKRSFPEFNVAVLTTISKDNLTEVEELKKFTKTHFPALHHGFHFVRSASLETYALNKNLIQGFDPQDTQILLSEDQMAKMVDWLASREANGNQTLLEKYTAVLNHYIPEIRKNKKRRIPCLAGMMDGVVYSDGEVGLCEIVKPFASLRDYDYNFYALWWSEEATKMRQMIKTCACTHSCHLFNSMRYHKETLLKLIE
jgi:MoaA/NifB/PqqE/SkfB family radical SAM enzyme